MVLGEARTPTVEFKYEWVCCLERRTGGKGIKSGSDPNGDGEAGRATNSGGLG